MKNIFFYCFFLGGDFRKFLTSALIQAFSNSSTTQRKGLLNQTKFVWWGYQRPSTKLIIEIALLLSEIGSGWIIPAKHPKANPPPYPHGCFKKRGIVNYATARRLSEVFLFSGKILIDSNFSFKKGTTLALRLSFSISFCTMTF